MAEGLSAVFVDGVEFLGCVRLDASMGVAWGHELWRHEETGVLVVDKDERLEPIGVVRHGTVTTARLPAGLPIEVPEEDLEAALDAWEAEWLRRNGHGRYASIADLLMEGARRWIDGGGLG